MINLSALVLTNLGQLTTVQSTATYVQVSEKERDFFINKLIILKYDIVKFPITCISKTFDERREILQKRFLSNLWNASYYGSFIYVYTVDYFTQVLYLMILPICINRRNKKIANAKLLL